jgi:nickel transport protein
MTRRSWLLQASAACCLALLMASAAAAHQIHLSAVVDGRMIRGQATALGDEPLAGATVTAYDPSGRAIGRATTDAAGRFVMEVRRRADHRLVLDAGEGHAVERLVPAEQLPADLPTGRQPPEATPSSAAESPELLAELQAIRQQLSDLRLELDRYQNRIRLTDILGGLGCIFGVMGVAFYFLGTRRK